MPKKAADGGGNYIGSAGLIELGNTGGIVLLYKRRQLPDFKGDDGPATNIEVDLAVVAPEKRAGEFWPVQGIINKAVTSKLVDEPDGTVIVGRLDVGKRGANKYPMLNSTSEPEDEAVEAFYAKYGIDISDDTCDEALFSVLRDLHKQELRAEVNEQTAKATKSAPAASAPVDDDDEPPF